MNSKDLRGLCESYGSIYYPEEELTEEQVWEEVETWVNSLVEEGYDLSDYTWEEMYEAYIEEAQSTGQFYSRPTSKTPTSSQQQVGARKALQSGQKIRAGGFFGASTVKLDSAATKKSGRSTLRVVDKIGSKQDPTIKLGGITYDRLTTKSGVGYVERQKPQSGSGSSTQKPKSGSGSSTQKPQSGSGGFQTPRTGTSSRPAPSSTQAKTAPTPASSGPAIGKLGNTTFERRTPTSAELKAAQQERERQKSSGLDTKDPTNAEKALRAAQKTNLPTTGPSPAIPDLNSVSRDLARANTVANLNRAPAGSAAAKELAAKPATSAPTSAQIARASRGITTVTTPGNNDINNNKNRQMNNSFSWGSTSKLVDDIANAYSSIYEAKKKLDQDQDGDNDFADIRIARMIASGVPKEVAIAKVRGKSYNEEVEIDEAAVNWNTGRTKSGLSPEEKAILAFARHGLSDKEKDHIRALQIGAVHKNMTDAIKQTGERRLEKVGPIASKRFANAAARKRGARPKSVPIRTVPGLRDANSKALVKDDFEFWINSLINEGYDLSDYTWDEMYEAYLDEATATPPSKFNTRRGLSAKSRRLRRSRDFYAYGQDPDPEERKISTSKGEGGITKNPKKLRKQKAMGELDEATEEEKNERRARIAELQAQGRVMTSSKRASQKAKERREAQKSEKLEKEATKVLNTMGVPTRRSSAPMGSTPPEEKPAAPSGEGARRLQTGEKIDPLDNLIKKARRGSSRKPSLDDLIKDIQSDFTAWVGDLLDEGYELDNWTVEDLYDLYEEILEEKYGTAAGRKRVAKKVHSGEDIGKKGPGFQTIVNKLTPKYGKERATKIAAAQMWKTQA